MKDACWTVPSEPGLLPWQSYLLAFVAGILGVRFPVPAAVALCVVYVADATFRGRACRLPLFAFLLCAVFGFGYASQRTPDAPDTVPGWVESLEPVMVSGVAERVEPRPGNRLRVILRGVRCESGQGVEELAGKLSLTLRNVAAAPVPGQAVRCLARVVPVRNFGNPGGWDYEWYWQRQGVFWRGWPRGNQGLVLGDTPDDFLWAVKTGLRDAVRKRLPDSQGGAMVLALTTGDRSLLRESTMDMTRSGGLAHTLALSGLHVGFVAAMGLGLALLAGWLWPGLLLHVPRPKLAVILAAPLVLGYAWLGQLSASLIRAAVMFGFWGLLLLQGRGRVLMDGLFFALAAIVFVSPLSAFDLGLQMSVTAVAGIGLLYPLYRSLFFGRTWYGRLLGWAGGLLAVSLSANLALLPLISWYFGTFSPNILLNLIWLPVLGFAVMPLGLIGMLLSFFAWTAPAGGLLLGWAAGAADGLLWLLEAAHGTGLTPTLAVLRPLWPEMLGFGLLLIAAVAALRRARPVSAGLAGAGFLLLVLPHVLVMAGDCRDRVRLTVLDVGLGQSLVITAPGGHRWLLDAGGGSRTFDLGEAVVGPALSLGRPPRLDGVFMTHPDVDHSHGLPYILDRFSVGAFYTNGMLPRGLTGERLREVLAERDISPKPLKAGDEVELSSPLRLAVLHPAAGFDDSHANERSLVLRLMQGGRGLALLPGDVETNGVDALLASGADLSAEVLVLPHHGSRTSLDPAFYRAVSAAEVLCSNGYLNRYGFPHPEVAGAVAAPVRTTSELGRMDAVWSGGGASISSGAGDLYLATGLFLR